MKMVLKQRLIVFSTLLCRPSSVKWMQQQSILKYTILTLLISATLLTLFATSIRPVHVEIQGMGRSIPIHLPLKEHSDMFGGNTGDYTFTGSFSSSLFSQHIVHITPDDCINSFWINGVHVNLDTIITGDTCDYSEGFDIDLKNYLKDGNNQFKIELTDNGGWLGLRIQHSSYDWPYLVLLWTLRLEIMMLLYFFLTNYFQISKGIVLVILLGLLLRVLYLSYTPYDVRAYDVLECGRQYFGNFLLKSMLFGEFSFPSAAGKYIAQVLSVLLLQMVAFLFIGLFISSIKLKPSNLLMILWQLLFCLCKLDA